MNEDTTKDDSTTPGCVCRCICSLPEAMLPTQKETSPGTKSDAVDTSPASSSKKKSVSFGSETEIGLAHPYADENEEGAVLKHASEHPPTPCPSASSLSRYTDSEEDLLETADEKTREDDRSVSADPPSKDPIVFMVTELTKKSDFLPHSEKSIKESREFSKEVPINGETINCERFGNKEENALDLALVIAEEIVKDVCREFIVKDFQEMRDGTDCNTSCEDNFQEELRLSLISNEDCSRRNITRIEDNSNDLERGKSFNNCSTGCIKKRLNDETILKNIVCGEEPSNRHFESNLNAISNENSRRRFSQAIDAPPNDTKRELSFQNAERSSLAEKSSSKLNVRLTDDRTEAALDRISGLKDFIVEMRNQIMEEDKHGGETRPIFAADNVSGGFDPTGDSSESTTFAVIQPEEHVAVAHLSDVASTSPKSVDVEEHVASIKSKFEDLVVRDSMSVEGFSFQPSISAEESSVTAAGEGSCDETHHLAPVLEGREIGLNEDLVRGSLSVFSVKGVAEGIRTSKVQPTAPPFHEIAERYSFGNLWRPEISKIACLKACGKESLEGMLESVCEKDPSAARAHKDDHTK